MVRRRVSPPPSPPREERPVPQAGIRLEEAEGQVLPPAPVRLEIIGVGEEEEIVELEELVHGGVDEEVPEAPILGPQERRVRGGLRARATQVKVGESDGDRSQIYPHGP